MIQWLKRLLLGENKSLEDVIADKYLHHPMLNRPNEYFKNPKYWANYYKHIVPRSELKEFGELIDDYFRDIGD